ncbi:NUDIX domain-containing protein [Actinokineospora guangxiensis]|uniref:NUDIX domain-containing protein n=1 Tax=Actinokineospora guangxiensis TaxID=1490288 RepID=A0ABW0EPL8_9PSEU
MSIQFAQKAIIVSGASILLVRKSVTDPHNPSCWELPGGRMKDGEGVDEHLRREIWEEVGLDVSPQEPVALWSWLMERDGDVTTVVAVARRCSPVSGTLTGDNRDIDDHIDAAEWVPFDQVLDRDLIPSQKAVLTDLVVGLG